MAIRQKCMDDESQQHGISFVRMHELIFVGLFAKVEVRRDRMLEEVNDEVAEQKLRCRRSAAQFQTFGNHLNQRCGQHESGTQRNKVAR